MSVGSQSRPPNLFVVGARKAGTTTLWEYLRRHPAVGMSNPKEPNHFTYRRRETADYLGIFPDGPGVLYRGEASTSYSFRALYPGVPEAIHALSPDARIIYIVRDPIRRIESDWVQSRSMLYETVPDFDEAVRTDPRSLAGSRYWSQLVAYRSLFADESILVLFFEDLMRDPQGMSDAVWRFLEIPPLAEHIGSIRENPSAGKTRVNVFGRTLQRVGIAGLGRRFMPQRYRQALRRRLSKPIEAPEWRTETLEWARSQLIEEAHRVLAHCGRPMDYWDFEPRWDVVD